MASTSTPVTTPPNAAIHGLRRAHRQDRSIAQTWRARIGSPARNRRRSSASASAVAYRCRGSRAIALSVIVSRSRGRSGRNRRGAIGSAEARAWSTSIGVSPRDGGCPVRSR